MPPESTYQPKVFPSRELVFHYTDYTGTTDPIGKKYWGPFLVTYLSMPSGVISFSLYFSAENKTSAPEYEIGAAAINGPFFIPEGGYIKVINAKNHQATISGLVPERNRDPARYQNLCDQPWYQQETSA